MAFDPISAALTIGTTLIEKIWPDPVKQQEEIRKLQELAQAGDIAQLNAQVQLLTGQMAINSKEAEHKSIFVAGWRPFVGWVGGIALAYQFILYPLMLWGWAVISPEHCNAALECVAIKPPPILQADELYTVLLGMLGIGAMRSYDKKNGTATNSIQAKNNK